MSNAFVAPGTSAANTARDRQSTVQKGARDAFNEINPLMQDQAKFATQLGPSWQRSVWNNINASSPWGVQRAGENYRTGQMGTTIQNLPIMRQILSRGGAGIGAMQGAELGAVNDANSRANEFMAYWASPEGQRQLALMQQQAIEGGMSIPSLGPANSLAGMVYGRPAPQVGQSPLAGIANIAGTMAGAGVFK